LGDSIVFEEGVYGRTPMVFGVTRKAIYVTKEQHFKQEAWYLERIDIPNVEHVGLKKEKGAVVWILGAFVFLGGLALTLGFVWNIYNALPRTRVPIVPWPLIFMAAGVAIPFLGRGRRILSVKTGKKVQKWKPSIFEGKKEEVHALQDRFIEACRGVGISVSVK
ncbi:MAG: hypothetical protein ACJ73D_14235, partial [Pyrinomonadaceae bacterium]